MKKEAIFFRKNFINSPRGITLISLIVTIIVLLILSGVTLNLVAGGDGILTRTETVVSEHNLAAAKEDIEIAWAGLNLKYDTEWSKNHSIKAEDVFTLANWKNELQNKGEVDSYTIYNEEGDSQIVYIKDGVKYVMEIKSTGKITIEKIVEE